MKLFTKSVLIICLFLSGTFNNIYAQTDEQQVLAEEKKIELYIEQNLKTPLPKEDLVKFIEEYNQEVNAHAHEDADGHKHGHVFQKLSTEEQESLIQSNRTGNLRSQYFKEHPKASEIYKSPPAPICLNGGFELGNFDHYEGASASGSSGGYREGECNALPTDGCGNFGWSPDNMMNPSINNFTIVGPGSDPTLANHGGGFLSKVHSGNSAARINSPKLVSNNNCWPNYGINKLIKSVTLQEDGFQEISFYYALVSEFPNHPNRNPVFVARALDQNQSEQDRICIISNPSNNPFFNQFTPVPALCGNNPADVLWQNWTCGKLEVDGKIGEELILEFIMTDCGAGGHFGYAYVDDICEPCDSIGGDTMGNIDLDDLDPCQKFPFDVCGEFELPELNGVQGTLNSLSLDILQNGVVVGTLTNYTLIGNTFCFTVDAADFPSQSGGYDFRANAIFGINGGITPADDTHTTPGQNNDYIFDNPDCCEIDAVVSGIRCDDQGTYDPDDDTWSFDLIVTNSEYYCTGWEASDPINTTGAYGVTTNISMGLISGYGSTIDFKVFDTEDIECLITLTIDVPASCSEECTLEAITSISSCSDNGTPLDPSDDFYNITLDVFNTQGQPWMVLNSNMSIIYFGVGDENNIDLGNYLVSDQSEWFWVKFSNDPDCFVDVVVLAPESCNFSCNIEAVVTVGECDDNGTPNDTSDDFYFITVHVVGTNGLPWQLIGHPNGQAVSASGTGNVTSIVLGPISTNDSSWPLYIFSTDPQHQDCRSENLIHAPTCSDKKERSLNKVFISPNPNSGDMGIRGELEKDSDVVLNIYKFDGTLMETLKDIKTSRGAFNMNYQSNLPTGLYYFIFRVDGENVTKKVIIR